MKTVTVQSLPDYNYTMMINDGRHAWYADEPLDNDGNDLGPSPYELLLSALGGCMAITALMYARRKEWPVYEISVHLSHEKVHPADCAECTDDEIANAGNARIDVIRTSLSVRGDLTEEQRARLLEIAGRCPVHRTLETPPKFVASISTGP
ncbi:MAG: OsmC family peroxiredoxin [Dehalococcoidia bacterium]|nr:OsmC family peroxiredoxin [Dehalococcoidia bacterium]